MTKREIIELERELEELQDEMQLKYLLPEPTISEKDYKRTQKSKQNRLKKEIKRGDPLIIKKYARAQKSKQNRLKKKIKGGDPLIIKKYARAQKSKQNRLRKKIKRGDPLIIKKYAKGDARQGKSRFVYTFYLSTGEDVTKLMRSKMVPTKLVYGCSGCPGLVFFFDHSLTDHVRSCPRKRARIITIPLRKVVRHESDGTKIVIVENLKQTIPVKVIDLSNDEVTPVENSTEKIYLSLVKMEQECESDVPLEIKTEIKLNQGLVKMEDDSIVPLEIKKEI